MYIHGYYYNRLEEKISVYILIRGDRSEKVEMVVESPSLMTQWKLPRR